MKFIFIIFFITLSVQALKDFQNRKTYSYDAHQKAIVTGKTHASLAWGVLDEDSQQDGWTKLTLFTHGFKLQTEAYAAGYLEGAFTATQIYQHRQNYFQQIFGNDRVPQQALVNFLNEQYQYTESQVQQNKKSTYWHTVGLYQAMLRGMVDGYNSVAENQLELIDFLILQQIGDNFDLVNALDLNANFDWFSLDRQSFDREFLLKTHCSSLIKVSDDLQDAFVGHNSWNSGQCMVRTYKFYYFGADFHMQMTSYPGTIFSLDDFYIMDKFDQKLFVTETSNINFNLETYSSVTPQSLLCWQRVLVANTLARSGQQWTEIFTRENSGTYNNQYIVVDMKRFIPGLGAQMGFLWIVEQMPNFVMSEDVTKVMIEQGNYWPSYNVPYFKEMFDYAGYDKAVEKYGEDYSYAHCPRANIFRRDHVNVQSLEDEKHILRYNDFKNDPFSKGNPTFTVSARGDLFEDDSRKMAFFAYDAKATSWQRVVGFTLGKADIQNGPTHENQPAFKWSDYNFDAAHEGQPDEFNFDWVTVKPDFGHNH